MHIHALLTSPSTPAMEKKRESSIWGSVKRIVRPKRKTGNNSLDPGSCYKGSIPSSTGSATSPEVSPDRKEAKASLMNSDVQSSASENNPTGLNHQPDTSAGVGEDAGRSTSGSLLKRQPEIAEDVIEGGMNLCDCVNR